MKIYVSHSSSYDYENELYAPLKEALSGHEVFYPHDQENIEKDAKVVLLEIDLLIAEVSLPSTGQGMELGIADMLNVRIICVHKSGSSPSSSIRFVSSEIAEYTDSADLIQKINSQIANP